MVSNDLKVRDIVFPLILAKKVGSNAIEMVAFLGTGFLVGSEGYALTAAHVIDVNLQPLQAVVGMFVDKETNKWQVFNVDTCDIHPTEDVALLKMRNGDWYPTDVKVSFEKQFSSFEYKLFGYPDANLRENVDYKDANGRVLGRPDLIYSSGHIRRRVSFNLPGIKGKYFYELSQPVGPGCSGSPVFASINGVWHIVGVYVADKTESVAYEAYDKDLNWGLHTIEIAGALSYAVRMDDLQDWLPKVLNTTLDKIP